MCQKALIQVKGPHAELYGVSLTALEELLTFDDPRRFYIQAFRDGRWDGKVRLYSGRSFPAGHVPAVTEWLKEHGNKVLVTGDKQPEINLTRFDRKYLPGITLRGHQYDACLAMLTNPRMIARIPTRGGKTATMAAVARFLWEELGYKSLVIVPSRGLLHQTAKTFKGFYGSDLNVGVVGNGERYFGEVTIATAATLVGFRQRKSGCHIIPGDPALIEFLTNVEALFFDEFHHASAATWYEIAMACVNAKRRYGLSGTPLKGKEIADARAIGTTGPVLYECEANDLIDKGLANKPKIAVVMSENASGNPLPTEWTWKKNEQGKLVRVKKHLPWRDAYEQVVNDATHNRNVIRGVKWFVDHGRSTLLLCRRKPHFRMLQKMLQQAKIPFAAVWGAHDVYRRDEAKKQLENGDVQVLLATEILSEGENMPGLGAIALAEGISAYVNAVQRVGRGMEITDAGDVYVLDFVPMVGHPTLVSHAVDRISAWEQQGYEVKVIEDWPEDDAWKGMRKKDYDKVLPFLNWDRKEKAVA